MRSWRRNAQGDSAVVDEDEKAAEAAEAAGIAAAAWGRLCLLLRTATEIGVMGRRGGIAAVVVVVVVMRKEEGKCVTKQERDEGVAWEMRER